MDVFIPIIKSVRMDCNATGPIYKNNDLVMFQVVFVRIVTV